MTASRSDLDAIVLPFLDAANEDAAREQLGELLIGHASPLIRQIVGRQLLSGGGAAARVREQDAEDLHGSLILRLTAQLWALRRDECEGGAVVPAETEAAKAAAAETRGARGGGADRQLRELRRAGGIQRLS